MAKVIGHARLEQIVRRAAGIDLDKNKTARVIDIVEKKLYDLLKVGEENAKYNDRQVIWLSDIPLTMGFRESMKRFKELEEEVPLEDILKFLASKPPLKYPLEAELEQRLPEIVGTLIYIVARILKEVSEDNRYPSEEELDKTERILNLTL
ncbi:MAG TPA: DUF1931 family protein [Aquifex aeolicus]|uniref:DUF1931 family protein n=1 Tax=Aquifex aeolicus TaxID=63363 RepID=A0A9D0YPF1_AQUAO|nr:DUF1931 family protein [Aquificales bacterium]HIP98367.1 DUF1931 family protein [Aquifex aeolicus]HIQ25755.1 DUF1931 family protein [Aquifex aeolicus]